MLTQSDIETIVRKEFDDCLAPLREISLDSENNVIMVDRPERFFHYDKITESVYKGGNCPKSPDMLLFGKNSLVFVEFKNGKIHSSDRVNIKLKALEGSFIVLHKIISNFRDIEPEDICKLKKSYILVYNEAKNPRRFIHDHLFSKGARFGLSLYQGMFFVKVKTVPPEVFSRIIRQEEQT